jgi:hypothetical protein
MQRYVITFISVLLNVGGGFSTLDTPVSFANETGHHNIANNIWCRH